MGENKHSGGQKVGPKLGSPNILFSCARFSSVGWLGVGDRSYYPIIVNLDESAVPVYMGDWKGNVIRLGRQRDLSQRIPRRQLRAQVPHVTLIFNEERLQLLLPQVRIGERSTLTVVLQRELQAELPDNVTLWQLASRWVVWP